jgi:hypothetical protein
VCKRTDRPCYEMCICIALITEEQNRTLLINYNFRNDRVVFFLITESVSINIYTYISLIREDSIIGIN